MHARPPLHVASLGCLCASPRIGWCAEHRRWAPILPAAPHTRRVTLDTAAELALLAAIRRA